VQVGCSLAGNDSFKGLGISSRNLQTPISRDNPSKGQ
jgi:hypothetical protein